MWVSKYFLWFVLYSFFGWVFEIILGIVKTGKWENRGFLLGPVCPIYGVGAVAVTGLCSILRHRGFDEPLPWQLFAFCFIGSIFLEYGTSLLLEKLFHAMWWDYSDMPLNINGRICLPASLAFGFAGVVIIYGLDPRLSAVMAPIPGAVLELAALAVMALLAADTALTVSALTDFEARVAEFEAGMDAYMEQLIGTVQEKYQDAGQRLAEEREKFYSQNIGRALQYMDSGYKAALRRVKRLKPEPARYSAKTREVMERMMNFLKRRT